MKHFVERENEFSYVPPVEGEEKDFYLEGIFIQTNKENRNHRIYPMEVVEPEVKRYEKEYIEQKRAFGCLNHPSDGSPSIDLKEVSHYITKIWKDGDYFKCRAKILDTPNGRIVKALIKEGCKLGVSTRALGSVTQKNGVNYVNPDFHLVTAGDIVFEPSAQSAFPKGLMESAEWEVEVSEDGTETYRLVENVAEEPKAVLEETVEKTEETPVKDEAPAKEEAPEKEEEKKEISEAELTAIQLEQFKSLLKTL